MEVSRRKFLLSSVSAVPILLSGCATLSSLTGSGLSAAVQAGVTQAETMISACLNTLSGLAALNIPQLTPTVVGKVQTALAGLGTVTTALGSVSSDTATKPIIAQVETYINAIVGALAGIPLPPPFNIVVAAAAVSMPLIETAVGLVATAIANANASTAAPVVQATVPATSAAQPVGDIANAILSNYAKK